MEAASVFRGAVVEGPLLKQPLDDGGSDIGAPTGPNGRLKHGEAGMGTGKAGVSKCVPAQSFMKVFAADRAQALSRLMW